MRDSKRPRTRTGTPMPTAAFAPICAFDLISGPKPAIKLVGSIGRIHDEALRGFGRARHSTLAHAQEVKVGVNLPYTGIGAEFAQLDRPRHGDVSQAQCRQGEALQDHADQARRQEPGRQRCPRRDAGAAHPGQRRHPGRLGLFAERDRLGAGRQRRQEDGGDHERRHRAHHADVERTTRAVVQHVACRLCDRRSGGQAAQGQDRGGRLHRLPARQGQPGRVQALVRSQRRQGDRRDPDGRRRRRAGLHAVLPARQGQEARRVLRVRAGRRPRRRGGADLRRARHEGRRHQADRPRRHHAGHQAAGDGRRGGRHDHHASLQRRPRQRREQALRRGLEEGIRRRTRRRTSWRSAATTAWR